MTYKKFMKEFSIYIIIAGIIIFIGLLTLNKVSHLQFNLTELKCCNGKACTDTYYTEEDNKCHLLLCERKIFGNKSICTYEGRDIATI